jgi:LPXTG-motif cell wall-anchored protein
MANRWLKVASAAAAAVGLTLIFGAAPASADTAVSVDWTGNGAQGGTCEHVGTSDDLNPGAGQQGWLFILTQPFDSSGSTLTYDFADPPNPDVIGTVAGVHMGGGKGSYHFAVYVPIGATLVSATASNGTGGSNLVVSHCTDGSQTVPNQYGVTSQVIGANNTVIDDSADPGTAPADVHDSVTVTETGSAVWSGTIEETFFTGNNCDVNKDTTTLDVDQSTTMPVSILPETGLAAGEYSYQANFTDGAGVFVTGACEPFKIVDVTSPSPSPSPSPSTSPSTSPGTPSTSTTPGLPVTGESLTGILVAGVALIAAGGAALFFMRRRRTAAGE